MQCKVYVARGGGPRTSTLFPQRQEKPSSCSLPTPGSSGEQEALQKGPLEGWLEEGGRCYLLASERCSRESLHVVSPVMEGIGHPLTHSPAHPLTHSLTDSLTQPGRQCQLLWQPSIHPCHSGASESTPVNIMHGLLRGSDILNSGHFSRSIHPGSAS